MLEEIVNAFHWTADWDVDQQSKTVTLLAEGLEQRTRCFADLLNAERQCQTFKVLRRWSDEYFSIWGPDQSVIASLPRLGAPLFGIVTYGVQMLAYTEDPAGELKIWIARRAATKRTYPGMLDSTVGGSMCTGETPFECLVRESAEEACLKEDLIRSKAKSCGAISYICRTDERGGGELGLFLPEVQYCYELQVSDDVTPSPGDDEAEEFLLMTIHEVQKALANGDFTPANGCIILNFLIQHGILTFENEKDYIDIIARLHHRFPFPTR